MEAISHAGTVLAVLSKEGIAMAAEKVCRQRQLFVPAGLGARVFGIPADEARKSLVNSLISR